MLAQPLILALGAVPIYWWAKGRLGDGILPFALGMAFLLCPALAWITVLDFHLLSLATPLMGFALYALLQHRMALFVVPSLPLFVTLLLAPTTWPGMVESHYGASLAPFVFFAAVDGCRWLVRWGGQGRQTALKRALGSSRRRADGPPPSHLRVGSGQTA